ncbi:hypothetical protein GE061_004448 [Apolygus lucorum]|uniref:Uncharacterized protein n=1 Tax=Apolygus lucorum TaxID=248454 RepID=A0A6A4INZ7_APOLU|nr:hypothetical protein GE061_004448 [Apolygus lucorum]
MAYDLKNEDDVKQYVQNLGTEYRFGCFNEKKPEVCHLLGDFLESISKDYQKASKVYRSNCDDYNFPKSCYKTGTYHLSGKGGVEVNGTKAFNYYEKGCNLGDSDSCFRAGWLSILNAKKKGESKQFLKNPNTFLQGVKCLTRGCEKNQAEACHHLSSLYMDGNTVEGDALQKDMEQAFSFALKACELGQVHACANVSLMYKRGEGVDKDEKKSEVYRRIALDKIGEANAPQITFQEGLKPA